MWVEPIPFTFLKGGGGYDIILENNHFRIYHVTIFGRILNRKKGKGEKDKELEADSEENADMSKRAKEIFPYVIVIRTNPEQVFTLFAFIFSRTSLGICSLSLILLFS
jgi:hypothetical protein